MSSKKPVNTHPFALFIPEEDLKNMEKPILVIVVPAYNEEEILPISIQRLTDVITELSDRGTVSDDSYICIVDDGSKDKTWPIIRDHARLNSRVRGIKLSTNRGHQNALIAGLESCIADVYISIDADLQDDENTIKEMLENYHQGSQIVYGVRKSRTTDSRFKRWTALCFYKLMGYSKTGTLYNHADYRLLSRRVVKELAGYGEVNLFLRAIIPSLGFKTSTVFYDRKSRDAGESKYSLYSMLSFAWEGITSFSTVPLKLVSVSGLIIFFISSLAAAWSVYQKLNGNVIPGWTSTVLPILFLGGIQLLCTGIVGEYVGKIYQEVKHRPRFIVEEKTHYDTSDGRRQVPEIRS